MENKNATNFSELLMKISGISICLITAVLGIIYDSNLWPPAAIIYGGLGALVGFIIGWVIDKVIVKNKR